MKFIKSNPHPNGKKIGDCVVRAISIAEVKKWEVIFKELCEIGMELKNMPNSKEVYEEYFNRNGWTKNRMPRNKNGRRLKLSDFAQENPKLLFIGSVVKHLTTVENAVLLDTWDCSNKCIGNYYTKSK